MTSVIFSRSVSRRRVRAAAAAAGLAGVLVLTACSGDGGSDDESSSSPSGSASASASASADTGGGTGGSSSSSGDLAGSWFATTGGKAVVLMINGSKAGLFATDGTVCSGSASAETISLKCKDSNTAGSGGSTDSSKDRASGKVESVDKTTLRVNWEDGLGTETYTRSEGGTGTLPTGLPTADLGS